MVQCSFKQTVYSVSDLVIQDQKQGTVSEYFCCFLVCEIFRWIAITMYSALKHFIFTASVVLHNFLRDSFILFQAQFFR